LPDPVNIPTTTFNAPQQVWKWPGILAKNNILTDPTFWFCKNDPAFSGTYPRFIVNPSAARNALFNEFNATGRALSWEVVGGIKMSDPATTPVVYTRGLTQNGLWNATSGVYKDAGGFIAFLGGNVAFYPHTQNQGTTVSPFFSNLQTSTSTTRPQNVLQAITFNTSNAALSARAYGTPPPAGNGGMAGTPNGTPAVRGP
jgi:hypothetical protein